MIDQHNIKASAFSREILEKTFICKTVTGLAKKMGLHTILQTRSSGPIGSAGWEYRKCLEYWNKYAIVKLHVSPNKSRTKLQKSIKVNYLCNGRKSITMITLKRVETMLEVKRWFTKEIGDAHTLAKFICFSLIWEGEILLKRDKSHPGCMASLDETNTAIC